MSTKRYTHFSLEERCTIARLREDGQSLRQIATALDRAPSSISREIKRNTGAQNSYKAVYADEQAWARRWTGSRLERDSALRETVLALLRAGWSPEQVAGRIHTIGKETIYRFIYAQITRTKDYSWRHYLPRAKSRRGFRGKRGGSPALHIKGRTPICDRPDTSGGGHFEADTLLFSRYGQAVLVLLEKQSRAISIHRLSSRHACKVSDHIQKAVQNWPQHLRRTLTVDNGTEFADHTKNGITTYFCDPHKPWQKGAVENANGRIRRWLPRKTDLTQLTQKDLDRIAELYNHTPRKCLGFHTPAEVKHNMLHFKWDSTSPLSRGC
jgi:IS30 family transposase